MNSDFSDLLQCLNNFQAEYLVVGGYAVIAYAEPRFTKNLDVWVRPTPENAERVYRALAKFGAPLSGLTVKDLATPGLVYQIGVPPVRVDILMSVDGIDFDEAWPGRNWISFGEVSGWIIGRDALVKSRTSLRQDAHRTCSTRKIFAAVLKSKQIELKRQHPVTCSQNVWATGSSE